MTSREKGEKFGLQVMKLWLGYPHVFILVFWIHGWHAALGVAFYTCLAYCIGDLILKKWGNQSGT